MHAKFYFISLMSLPLSLAAAPKLVVSGPITQTTVYEDRARVTREISIDIPAGTSLVQVPGLPWRLNQNSVEVGGVSGKGVTIQGIDLKREVLAANANPKAKALQDQIQQLENQEHDLFSQKTVLQQQEIFLRNLSLSLGRSEKSSPTLEDVRSFYGYYTDQLNVIAQKKRETELSEQKLQPTLEQLKKELSAITSAKEQKTLEISLLSEVASTARLQIRYWIEGASWQPVYQAKMDSSTGKVTLVSNALVRQNTGEDWNGVRLTLSTAKPGQNGSMPEFNPEYLNFVEPPPPAPPRPVPLMMKNDRVARSYAAEAPIQQQNAQLQTLGLSVSYDVALPATVPSDDQMHQTNLTALQLQAEPLDVTLPRLDPSAYLKLHVTNTSGGPLLPGRVDIFRDGDAVGNLELKYVPASADFDLFGGRDDAVKVERKELVNNASQSGIINRKKQTEKKYQITVQNFRNTAVKLALYDQLPVSQNSQITVTQGQFSDKPEKIDADTGKITWNLVLQPKEKKVITFGYTISWPEDKQLND